MLHHCITVNNNCVEEVKVVNVPKERNWIAAERVGKWEKGAVTYLLWPHQHTEQKRVCVFVGTKSPPRPCGFGVFRRTNSDSTSFSADKACLVLPLDGLVIFI